VTAVLWLTAAAWAGFVLAALHATLSVTRLPPRTDRPTNERRVSIVIAARDEAARIRTTVLRLLEQTGVDAEIVVVDDRSTDGTPAILAELAAEHARLKIVRVETLPEGWIGKPHACHVGAQHAGGTWLLFTDGDAWMRDDLVARTIDVAERDGADHVCLVPAEGAGTATGRATLLALYMGFVLVAAATNRDRFRGPVGVGAYNLIRAEAYRRVGGHVPLRYELIDDAKLGMLMLKAGFRMRVYHAGRDLEVVWGGSLRGIVRAVEKNAFAGMGFRLTLATLACTAIAAAWIIPIAGALGGTPAGLAAATALAALIVPASVMTRRLDYGRLTPLLVPLVIGVIPVAIANSAWRAWRRGGVVWRGTFYPLDRLRRGAVW